MPDHSSPCKGIVKGTGFPTMLLEFAGQGNRARVVLPEKIPEQPADADGDQGVT
jgi:hypothetical protein